MLTKLPAGSFFGATTLRRDIGGVDVTVSVRAPADSHYPCSEHGGQVNRPPPEWALASSITRARVGR